MGPWLGKNPLDALGDVFFGFDVYSENYWTLVGNAEGWTVCAQRATVASGFAGILECRRVFGEPVIGRREKGCGEID